MPSKHLKGVGDDGGMEGLGEYTERPGGGGGPSPRAGELKF